MRNGRRLIVVVTGLASDKVRGIEAERLLTRGFNEFETYTLLSANQKLEDADVWLGDSGKIPLVVANDVRVTLPRDARKSLQAKLVYQTPLAAPVAPGAQVGTVTFTATGMQPVTVPVVAGAAVQKLGFFGKIPAAINYLLWGASSG